MKTKENRTVVKSAVRWVDIDTIQFDPAYQREVKARHKRIITNFKEEAFGIPLVAEREDGSLWCVDGLQRITAKKKLVQKKVRVEVFASTGSEYEADIFDTIQTNRTSLTPGEHFKARLTAHDKVAWEIKEAVESCGFKLALTSNKLGKKDKEYNAKLLSCINTLVKCYKDQHIESIRFALSTIKECWPGDSFGVMAPMVAGLCIFFYRHKGILDEEKFKARLMTTNPHKILYTASQMINPGTGGTKGAVSHVLDQLYSKRKRKSS